MFRHLLIPLDGSSLAEASLPAAAYVAKTLSAHVTLVHVIEHHAPQEVHGEHHLTDAGEAESYLQEVAARAFPAAVHVECHVHASEVHDVARSIVQHAGELRPDLIVMCTHGHGGLRGWLFGSIAQQVISLGQTPVMLIQPASDGSAPDFNCRRLMVALDGDPDHEQGLPVAAGLARACGAHVHLLMVVPTLQTLSGQRAATAKLLPGATSALLDLAMQGGQEYIGRQVARLASLELEVSSEVERGDPARVIVDTAGRAGIDLIVLGTHGKTGMDAFWSGSVTPRVSSQSRLPVLLVPVVQPESQS